MITVLYVDDEPDLLEIGKIFLEQGGDFSVDIIHDPTAALARLRSKKFDAIISDYQMPDVNGIEFLKLVRRDFGTIPFILFTGRGREEVVIEALNNGADFYLQKGGDPRSQFAELAHKTRSAVIRRSAEEALRTNIERLHMAQETGQVGSWEYDLATRQIWASEEAFRIFGMNRPSGSVPFEQIQSCYVDREKVYSTLVRLIQSPGLQDIEYAINPADGSEKKIIHSVAKPIVGPEGNVTKLFGVIQDITDKKRSEEALRESEEKHRLLLDESGDPIFSFYPDGTYRYVNRAFAEGVGKTVSEITGKRIYDVFPKDEADKRFSVLSGVFSTGVKKEFEVRVPRADGDRYYLTTVTPIKNDANEVISVICSSKEITDRKHAEDALRKAEENYRNLVDNSHEIIFMIRPDGILTFVSPSWKRLLGHEPAEVVGQDFRILVHADDVGACNDFLGKTIETRTKQPGIEFRVFHKDGTIRWHRSNIIPVFDDQKTIVSFVGNAVDFTDYRQASSALAMANRKLGLLSGITRHDIRNQLMALIAFLELSEKSLDKPDQLGRYLTQEKKIAETIGRQINFTQDYEEMGVKSPSWQNVCLHLRAACAALPVKDLRVSCECRDLDLLADPLLGKVFYNLLDNALRYGGPEMTSIRITCSEKESGLLLMFDDDGTGIPKNDKQKIFTHGFGKNTGLGLFLVREILSISGMTITETGVPGRGARFEIRVPKGTYRFSSPAGT